MSRRRLFPKSAWQEAIGASVKPKRLNLKPDIDGNFVCPVVLFDSEVFKSKRGVRKHVSLKHGWWYFFNEKPDLCSIFPKEATRQKVLRSHQRSSTNTMSSFSRTTRCALLLSSWLQSPGGGGKSKSQADQVTKRVLKYLKFCCDDVSEDWDIPDKVIAYCMGSISLLSDFIEHLRLTFRVGHSGILGYMNSLSHMLDYVRSKQLNMENITIYIAFEVYLDRVKKCIGKKMRLEWNTILSMEYLQSINCWATLEDLQSVIPYHSDKYAQILINCGGESVISPHELSFATSFVVVVLFIMVKATRPMTYQYLTIDMVESVKDGGFIDQTRFKTNAKYGFDSLLISTDCATLIRSYSTLVRPKLNPKCEYLLITRNGNQLTKMSDIFGRMVFQAIGKYIHPTRYRQIIETESSSRLASEEQKILSLDQKHTSEVAKVHYQKHQSRVIAEKGKELMEKLQPSDESRTAIESINTRFETDLRVVIKPIKNSEINAKSVSRNRESFSSLEDKWISDGLKKHGPGQWTAILKDPDYCFHPSRKNNTLQTRAKRLKLC